MTDYRAFPVFAQLDDAELAAFVADCDEIAVAAGATFIHQGRSGDHIYYLIAGEVEVFLEEEGERVELAVISAPAVVGELEALTGGSRAANVCARTETRLLEMSFDRLRERFQSGDPATLKVFFHTARVIARRLIAMNEKFAELLHAPDARHHDLRDFQEKLLNEWTF
jgi:CRP/FNR family transcriptional regulator, cyclic AMP receptor protein